MVRTTRSTTNARNTGGIVQARTERQSAASAGAKFIRADPAAHATTAARSIFAGLPARRQAHRQKREDDHADVQGAGFDQAGDVLVSLVQHVLVLGGERHGQQAEPEKEQQDGAGCDQARTGAPLPRLLPALLA